ncbi:hypothetical protein BH09MYX1_BH09MYX1_63020 [soil metagenome]
MKAIRAFALPMLLALPLAFAPVACGGAASSNRPSDVPLASLRSDGPGSKDAEVVGKWILAERLAPGGDTKRALEGEKRLRDLAGKGLYASLARGISAEEHGVPKAAAEGYASALVAAQVSDDPLAPLAGWYAANQLRGFRQSVTGLYKTYEKTIASLVATPGHLGWRAAAELNDWVDAETYRAATITGKDYDKFLVQRNGCVSNLRVAGPFGRGTAPDRRRHFAAEDPKPWPARWTGDPSRGVSPHVLKAEQDACEIAATEESQNGMFYVEGFFDLDRDRDLVIAVSAAAEIFVDDVSVLARDLRDFGVWQRFGAAVRIGKGRHRIVARLFDDQTTIRLLELDGRPAGVASSTDRESPWSMVPPKVLPDPNPLVSVLAPDAKRNPITAYLAAYLAHVEGMDDVANVLVEPYVEPEDAASFMLEEGASLAASDPAQPQDGKHKRARALFQRAVIKDDTLWYPRAWLILDDAEKKGKIEAVDPLRKLGDDVPTLPDVKMELAKIYGELGWRAERTKTLADLATAFPDDARVLRGYQSSLRENGSAQEADRIAKHLKELDPDAEIELDEALERHDGKAAIAELERLQKRRPDRKELAGRIAAVLLRSGDPSAAATILEKALTKNPLDQTSRFRLADRAYAKGDFKALRTALGEALRVGGSTSELRAAIDLLEDTMDLEPYRIDGRAAIAEFEAWEKKGKSMAGVSARVLDYSALWVHPDGSSEMLEHEILKVQSQEAIGKEAEQEPPSGMVLRLRVLKKNGRILEPEPVAGKPTLTMPNLEVGDYLEIEHVTKTEGDGEMGRHYRGPTWFFREADKGYWRSEFVVISPTNKELLIETRGNVAAPKTTARGIFTERRWRVDESPPLVEEPDSPPPQEFLPSVRVGWGMSFDETITRYVDLVSEETPIDPRIRREALALVAKVPEGDEENRARTLYRAILERLQDGPEKDGRRAWLGKAGSRQAAFQYLARAIGLKVQVVLAKSRLALPASSAMSEIETYSTLLLRLDGKVTRYLTVADKFAPFGYVPADVRGQPAVLLTDGAPRIKVAGDGIQDGVRFEGRADMRDDGGANVELTQKYMGKLAIRMRNVFDKIPEGQLFAFVESRLLASTLPGAHVRDVQFDDKNDPDRPLTLRIKADVSQFGKVMGDKVTLRPPVSMQIAQLASLATRQTPLLLGSASHVEVDFHVIVPASFKMPAQIGGAEVKDGDRVIRVDDKVQGHEVVFSRLVDLPAGRVQPGAEYAAFVKFTQDADALLEREVLLGR